MNKNVIAIAVSSALAMPVAAQAGMDFGPMNKAKVGGFADIRYTATDDGAATNAAGDNTEEGKFDAFGEVDVQGGNDMVQGRLDLDVMLDPAGNNAAGDSVVTEQAFFDWMAAPQFTVRAGQFNNPVGMEHEDTTDLYHVGHGQIYHILNDQTALYENNLAGANFMGSFGRANVQVGFLNDIRQADEENSIMIAVDGEVIPDLNVELGYLSQDGDGATGVSFGSRGHPSFNGGIGNIIDLNGHYKWMGVKLGAEYITADEGLDNAYGLHVGYHFPNTDFGANLRWDSVSYDISGQDDSESTTLTGYYQAAENLKLRAEWKNNDTGSTDNDLVRLQGVVTF